MLELTQDFDDLSDLDRPLTAREPNPYYDLPWVKQLKIKEIQKNYRAIFSDITDDNFYYQGYLAQLEDQGLPLIHWSEWVKIEQTNQQDKINAVISQESLWKRAYEADQFKSYGIELYSKYAPVPFLSLRLRRRIYLIKKLAKNNPSPTISEKKALLNWLYWPSDKSISEYQINLVFDYLATVTDDVVQRLRIECYFGVNWLAQDLHRLAFNKAYPN